VATRWISNGPKVAGGYAPPTAAPHAGDGMSAAGYMLEHPSISRYRTCHTPFVWWEHGGDNPTSAGNQQERPSVTAWLDRIPNDVGNYVAGFVEGEGSFNVPIRRVRGDRCLPWRVGLSFNVSQVGEELPQFLQSIFGVGTVRGRADGVFYFEVTRPAEIVERVIPFFRRFELRGPKVGDFDRFVEITKLIQSGAHLDAAGIAAILKLRATMNRGGKRRYSDQEILGALARLESSEATRQPTPV
jgi:hypothetical protein